MGAQQRELWLPSQRVEPQQGSSSRAVRRQVAKRSIPLSPKEGYYVWMGYQAMPASFSA